MVRPVPDEPARYQVPLFPIWRPQKRGIFYGICMYVSVAGFRRTMAVSCQAWFDKVSAKLLRRRCFCQPLRRWRWRRLSIRDIFFFLWLKTAFMWRMRDDANRTEMFFFLQHVQHPQNEHVLTTWRVFFWVTRVARN